MQRLMRLRRGHHHLQVFGPQQRIPLPIVQCHSALPLFIDLQQGASRPVHLVFDACKDHWSSLVDALPRLAQDGLHLGQRGPCHPRPPSQRSSCILLLLEPASLRLRLLGVSRRGPRGRPALVDRRRHGHCLALDHASGWCQHGISRAFIQEVGCKPLGRVHQGSYHMQDLATIVDAEEVVGRHVHEVLGAERLEAHAHAPHRAPHDAHSVNLRPRVEGHLVHESIRSDVIRLPHVGRDGTHGRKHDELLALHRDVRQPVLRGLGGQGHAHVHRPIARLGRPVRDLRAWRAGEVGAQELGAAGGVDEGEGLRIVTHGRQCNIAVGPEGTWHVLHHLPVPLCRSNGEVNAAEKLI
mmetsp:Transcript_137931/g.384673  ORF Transcript_137931/g.384673 Transcript_137931/m.384673 type:complete len:354 (-) Transcript_137931:1257-2318(-)